MNDESRPKAAPETPAKASNATVRRDGDSAHLAAPVVIARAHVVTACRGRQRLVLVVRCHLCGGKHEHVAPLDFTEGARAAGCGRGRYIVRAAVDAEVAAPVAQAVSA